MRDSTALVEAQRARLEAEKKSAEIDSGSSSLDQGSNVGDFFSAASATSSVQPALTDTSSIARDEAITADSLLTAGSLSSSSISSQADEQPVMLENEHIRLLLNPRGGSIYSLQLKDFLQYTEDSLYLFEGDEARFNLDLFNRNSVRLSTEDVLFTPIRSADGRSVTMRLQQTPQQYIDFVYTLPAGEYMMDFDIRVAGMKTGLHPESLTNFRINWEQKKYDSRRKVAYLRTVSHASTINTTNRMYRR